MGIWRLSVMVWILATGLTISSVQAANVRISGWGGAYNLRLTSLKEARWKTVVRQKYDYSCGSAATATLLTFHYDQPTGEEEVFVAMFEAGNKEIIQAKGFSMFDMKQYLDARGLQSDGFRMSLEKLAKLRVPGITMIETDSYKHFVVIKGIDRGKVLVGDPTLGLTVYPRDKFERLWSGALLAIRRDVKTARKHFNEDRDWSVLPKAPVGETIRRRALGIFSTLLPGRNEFGR